MENKNNSFETQLILSVGKESLPHVPQSQYGKQIPFQPPPELNRALSCEDNQPPPTSNFSINTFSLSDTRVTTADSVGEGGDISLQEMSLTVSLTQWGAGGYLNIKVICPVIQCAHVSSVPTYPVCPLIRVPSYPVCPLIRVPSHPVCPPV